MSEQYTRKVITEDGDEYFAYAFGASGDKACEMVFNTSMVGYQEIVSDPSYTDQGVVMTYPLIGNYGICDDDYECGAPSISALLVREYNDEPSNFRGTSTLDAVMKKYSIVGVSGLDTRRLTRSIRNMGTRRALITDINMPLADGLRILQATPIKHDAVSRVSCKNVWYSRAADEQYRIVAVDCGIKLNIVRSFNKRGCSVTVVPWNTSAEDIERLAPDGVFISNGPGDPQDAAPVIETIRQIRGRHPIFGICLGHQLIALAYGADTYKLKFGHRGGNHPVKSLLSGRIYITVQNHSYAVDAESVKNTHLSITHVNLLDGTVEGLRCLEDRVFSVQYHPESAPGPEDSEYLFDEFIELMRKEKADAKES